MVTVPEPALQFSVVIPTRGDPAKLASLMGALDRQTLARERFEIILALDRADLSGKSVV